MSISRFFCRLTINERMMKLDTKDFVLDLYEMELNKKSMYSDNVLSDKAKEGKEQEFAVAVKNIKIIEELLDLLENE